MKLTILLFSIFLFFMVAANGQNTGSIKGSIRDTTAKTGLKNAVISVLQAKDSILVKFTRAASDGAFEIDKLPRGKYQLLITYPGYADYVERFTLDSVKTSYEFGAINMLLKAKLLEDVIIKGVRSAIKIKGDTTEFDARAFVVQPNAKVEDLLKQLPGIQVDKDGKITAEGQAVNKVLVDGEEFFGDDPTLVTKNIRADMVDKVQLYDKKSDQATFTGIDDGQKTKTINIKLKADKKNGYFGKAAAADGTDGYYEGQLLYNQFTAKTKFSAFGITSNDGKTGLGWQDSQKYGSSDNMQVSDDGSMMFFVGGGDGLDSFDGQYNGQGLPTARTGGLHYDGKWDDDKQSLNANYKIGSLEVDGNSNTQTQNNTPNDSYFSNSNQTFDNYVFRQKLDLTYKITIDTTANLKLSVDGTLKNTHTKSSYDSKNYLGTDTLLNSNTRSIDNHDDTKIFDASAFYTKKLKKKGRTLSLLASVAQNETSSNGYLLSNTNYYDPVLVGKLDSSQYINQYKTADVRSTEFKTNVTYTEPLSKTLSAIFNYGIDVNNGISNLYSYNPSAPGVYNIAVDSLSDNYRLNQFGNEGGAILNYKKNKLLLNFGTKVANVSYNQTNEVTNDVLRRDFVNWMPQGNFSYRFSQQKVLVINYNGSTTQPTISQIQPIALNTDPLNVVVGNPGLTPSFTNRINFFYNSYKVLTSQSVFINGGYTFISNPIVSSLTTDTTGKTISQYVNVKRDQSNYYLNADVGRKIDKLDLNADVGFNFNGSNAYDLSNGVLNDTRSDTYGAQLRFSKYTEKKFEFSIGAGPNYTVSGSSLQPAVNNNGPGFDGNYYFNIYLPGKFQVSSDGNYQYRGKTETFNTNFYRTILNASVSRTFLKEDNLKITAAANDLLNQNVGFNRTVSGNFITQNTYTTIRRFFMLSITYDFTKMGGAPGK